jgi:preprotein translocase subunit SecA
VEGAQRKVEEINFAMRKNVLEYDDVMNKQRRVIYEERNKILDGKDLTEHLNEVMADTVWHKVSEFCPEDANPELWDLDGLHKWIVALTGKQEGIPTFTVEEDTPAISERVEEFVHACYEDKTKDLGDDIMHELSTQIMLRVIDTRWMAYLQEMDYLKTGIGLRGFGQRDPLVEYKSEAYGAFSLLVNTMYEDFLRTILRIEVQGAPMRRAAAARAEEEQEQEPEELKGASYSGPAEVDGDHSKDEGSVTNVPVTKAPMRSFSEVETAPDQAKRTPYRKANDADPYAGVGRNDMCPCGSGKKYKNCCGRPGAVKKLLVNKK